MIKRSGTTEEIACMQKKEQLTGNGSMFDLVDRKDQSDELLTSLTHA
jgi:hypothetical protein